MKTLYDHEGNAHEVHHFIDAKEWLATGRYFEAPPKEEKQEPKAEVKPK